LELSRHLLAQTKLKKDKKNSEKIGKVLLVFPFWAQ